MNHDRAGALSTASFAAAALVLVLTGCGSEESQYPEPDPTPSGPPTEKELVAFTALSLPDDRTDVEVDRSANKSGGLVYKARFTTSWAGAEQYCELGDNFSMSHVSTDPKPEEVKRFAISGGTVNGTTRCKGANLEADMVNREVVTTYPTEEEAVVHLVAEHLNTR